MLCNGLNIADNGYFTFQMIIDSWDAQRHFFFDAVCMGSLVIIIFIKKLTKKYTKIWKFQLE